MSEWMVGKNMRSLRKQKKITLQTLAERTGFTRSYLSKIERSDKAPPYSTLNKLAIALELEVSYNISERLEYFKDFQVCVNRQQKGQVFETLGSSYGYTYEALAYEKPGKNMQPFIIEPALEKRGMFKHEGEEFIYVLEGRYELTINDRHYTLEAGDSVYFDSGTPHSARSLGRKKAKVLSVMYNYKRL